MLSPNYNRIAWLYDPLSTLIFGDLPAIAKRAFLDRIPVGAKVLIIGGGTGRILDYLAKLDKALIVDYVEVSANMLDRARRKKATTIRVQFHHAAIQEFGGSGYQVIIANFFFDQFLPAEVSMLLQLLKPKLEANGLFLFSDFVTPVHFQDKIICRMMYLFFQLTADVRATSFPNYADLFAAAGFVEEGSQSIGRNIVAKVYKAT